MAMMFCLTSPVQSQEDNLDPSVAYNKAVSAIQLEKWDEGLKLVDGVIREHGEGAITQYGPVFGHFYFLKGLILLGKDNAAGAVQAFQVCYETFDNKVMQDASDGDAKKMLPNLFQNAALVQWANAEMKREKYAEARDLYKKVLVVAKDDSKVNKIYVGVNLGRCYLKAGELEKGFEFMSKPLRSQSLSDGLRETIFMIIAEDWSTEVEFPEVRSFLDEFSELIDFDPFQERYDRNPRFQYLAQLALSQQDAVRALAWYERMVNPRQLSPSYGKRFEQLESRAVAESLEPKKQEALAELQKQTDQLEVDFFKILNGVGSSHFMMQNFAGSYVAFSQLSDQAGAKHTERPVFLHNAVVSAAQTEQWKNAYHYGKQFLAEFPKHELKPGVAKVLVEVLFLREEYEEAYTVSGEVRVDMEEGNEIRDIPDFVRGASAFQLGHVEEAEQELSSYFKIYKDGERLELAEFFLGLSKVRLAKWDEAAEMLNGFLKRYPESPLTPTVLYQCAMSEFMLDELDAALAKVERIHSEYPNHEVAPSAWNLKGDLLATLGNEFPDLEVCYLQGRDGGKKMGQSETAAYALWQLVVQTVDIEDWVKAEAHYQDFVDNHGDSDYRNDLLVASLPMLVEQGRTDEGASRLRAVVWDHRGEPESTVLSEMFGSFADFLKESYEPDVVIEQLDSLMLERGVTPCLTGWATVAKVDVLEDSEAAQEAVNQLFYRLEAGFDPSQQSNYPIVRLARWVSGVRKKPVQAQPYYEFILENRPGTANFDYCLIDTAEIQAGSADPAERESAMEKFHQVMAEIPNEELQEKAVLGMARIRMEDENYEEAQAHWSKYLENRSWSLSRPEANYQLAFCLERQGNLADALKIYVSVYANFPGYLDWSTRAYLRTAAITKGRGQDLKALKILQDMLKRMGHHDHPGVDAAKKTFMQWRVEYEAKAEEVTG